MQQIPAQEPTLIKMLDWLNSNLPSHITPLTVHSELADGSALLFLLAHLNPTAISCTSIVQKPATENGVNSNLALLASVLQKMEPSFHLDVQMIIRQIGKLAIGQSEQVLRLLVYLFGIFEGKSTLDDKMCKVEYEENSTSMDIKTESSVSQDVLNTSKDAKEEIKTEELTELHQLRSKLKEACEIIKGNQTSRTKLKSLQKILQETEQLSSSEISKKKIHSKMISGYTKLLPEDILVITNPSSTPWSKKIPPCQTKEIQIGRQLFTKIINFKNSRFGQQDSHGLLHNLGFFTFEFLKNISSQIQLSKQENTIIQNYSVIYNIYESFGYLFFGIKLPGAFNKKYNFQQNHYFKNARKDLKIYCERYYQSTVLVKRLLFAASILMRTKLNFCRYLSNIQLLPSRNLKRIQFLSSQYRCFEVQNNREEPKEDQSQLQPSQCEDIVSQAGSCSSSQYYNPKNSGTLRNDNDNSIINYSIREEDEDSSSIHIPISLLQNEVSENKTEEGCNPIICEDVDEIISTERKPVPLYWSEHRRVLIAFEVKHVYNKKPNFQDKQSFNKFITSKAHERSEFDGGFLFPGRKNRMTIDFIKNVEESDKYPNLKILFDEEDASFGVLRLREFVKIMLELKHHSIVKQFLEIYDVMIGQIRIVPFEKLQRPTERFAIVDTVTKKVEKGVARINDYFINTYDMTDDSAEVQRLMRVTVYCFLAELHGFNENEFYIEAFDFPKIDKKLSTNIMIYEKAIGIKMKSQKL